jgi:predicted nucleic acid-binding protein
MRLLISDANILLDLEAGGLSEAVLRLDLNLVVPDVLFYEELAARHRHLLRLGLELRSLQPTTVQRALDLAHRYRRPSRNDLLAMALAIQEGCPLLTGDRDLRVAAREEGVTVHGTLWLLDHVAARGAISADGLRGAYQTMRDRGRRLPWAEVNRRLLRLGSATFEE